MPLWVSRNPPFSDKPMSLKSFLNSCGRRGQISSRFQGIIPTTPPCNQEAAPTTPRNASCRASKNRGKERNE